jgi:hypothetical protein
MEVFKAKHGEEKEEEQLSSSINNDNDKHLFGLLDTK